MNLLLGVSQPLLPARLTTLCILALSMVSQVYAREAYDLASLGNDGSLPDSFYNADHAAVTPDGRYVVFRSGESKLVSPNTSGYQIFLRDRTSGTTELISQSSGGQAGNNASDWPSISDDGCRVVFESDSTNLVSGDANGTTDVFLRDRCASPASTVLVSLDSYGTQAAGQSKRADISGDGEMVAFWSYATNLVPGVTRAGQIYAHNLTNGETSLVSKSATTLGEGGNFAADCPAVSEDGSRIAFWSYANDLVAGDANGMWDIFLYDANSDEVALVSTNSSGGQQAQGGEGISSASCPAISGDGRFVAFPSRGTQLIAGDTTTGDIFLKDTQTGTLTKASVSSSGVSGNGDSKYRPSLSQDGTWVAFYSDSTNLASGSGKVFVHNRLTGQTLGFADTSSGDNYPVISGDAYGRFLVGFWGASLDSRYDSSGVFVHDRHNQPVANAGSAQTVKVGDTVTLDGSGSYEPDNYFPVPSPGLTYRWTQLEGPEAVSFSSATAVKPTFVPATAGSYTFQLVVNDSVEDSEPSRVTITVQTPTPDTPGPQVDPNTGASVTLLTPDDGSSWMVGRKYQIQWSSDKLPKKKRLGLFIALDLEGNDLKLIKLGLKPNGKLKVKVKKSWITETASVVVCSLPSKKDPSVLCDAGNFFSILPKNAF